MLESHKPTSNMVGKVRGWATFVVLAGVSVCGGVVVSTDGSASAPVSALGESVVDDAVEVAFAAAASNRFCSSHRRPMF